VWQGKTLQGEPASPIPLVNWFTPIYPPTPCVADNCERTRFTINATGTPPPLVVAIQWEQQDEDYGTVNQYLGEARLHMDLWVTDLATGKVFDGIESGHYASVASLDSIHSGEYEVTVQAIWGRGSYQGAVTPQAAPPSKSPARDLLPDLVMLSPAHLQVAHPLVGEASPVLTAAGDRGCGPDETVDAQAMRCLRFASSVGNAGEGTFETHLSYDQATSSFTSGGQWTQRVFRTDGSFHDEPVGAAQYHAVHGHFHFLGMAQTSVYTYDLETHERGDKVAQGGKTGFCFIDGGLLNLTSDHTVPPQFFGPGCCYFLVICELDLITGEDFYMGINPNWYDVYPWWRADQYVEISGLADGVYELVSLVDPDHNAVESDTTNNEGSIVFRLTGDVVEELPQNPD
jgi:hypothetical protein